MTDKPAAAAPATGATPPPAQRPIELDPAVALVERMIDLQTADNRRLALAQRVAEQAIRIKQLEARLAELEAAQADANPADEETDRG